MDYKNTLLKMVIYLLDGTWTVSEFRDNYYDYYLEEVPDEVLSELDADFFGLIQEKLDWTDENPDLESRKYGWMDEPEFVRWAREYHGCYVKSKPFALSIFPPEAVETEHRNI